MNRQQTISESLRRVGGRTVLLCGMAALLVFAGVGCGDDAPSQPTAGYEAKGLALRVENSDAVVDSSGVHGSLSVLQGEMIDGVGVLFIEKTSGARSTPQGTDYKLEWTVADPTIASIEASGTWGIMLHGLKAGSTTATFKLTKGTSTVFTSSPIPIVVTTPVTAFKAGDTITYDFYDRDPSTNQRIATSKHDRKWIVLENGLSLYDRTNVTSILDITYTAGGTEFERDTIYIQKESDGSIWQYDLIRQTVLRIQMGDEFASPLPGKWVKLTSATSTSATTWASIEGDSIMLSNVAIAGVDLNVMMKDIASHKGTQSVTVPASTYADALHTDHSLKVVATLSGIGLQVVNDSLGGSVDYSVRDGVLRQTLDSRTLVTTAANLQVGGYEMELKSYVHAK